MHLARVVMACYLTVLLLCTIGCGGAAPTTRCDPSHQVYVPPSATWVQQSTAAPWRARDSAAAVVFNNEMWLMGGWFSSYLDTPSDVWSTSDGITWKNVSEQAPWTHGDFAGSVVFRGRMWMIGGWGGGRLPGASASNELWSSANGMNWIFEGTAPWSPRLAATLTEFNGRLWLMGGTEDYYSGTDQSARNDVWVSDDGKKWTVVTPSAPWRPRAWHQTVVFNDRMWVIGGGHYQPNLIRFNDVWSSSDGVNWREETASATWSPRIWFSSVVYRGLIWVIAGYDGMNHNDLWYSSDGKTWVQYLPTGGTWAPRHAVSAYVFDDKVWITAGYDSQLFNDTWSLQIPARPSACQ